jgi:hypothetical protein
MWRGHSILKKSPERNPTMILIVQLLNDCDRLWQQRRQDEQSLVSPAIRCSIAIPCYVSILVGTTPLRKLNTSLLDSRSKVGIDYVPETRSDFILVAISPGGLLPLPSTGLVAGYPGIMRSPPPKPRKHRHISYRRTRQLNIEVMI